jgi:hypothetical protein
MRGESLSGLQGWPRLYNCNSRTPEAPLTSQLCLAAFSCALPPLAPLRKEKYRWSAAAARHEPGTPGRLACHEVRNLEPGVRRGRRPGRSERPLRPSLHEQPDPADGRRRRACGVRAFSDSDLARPLATTGIDSGEARPLATTGIDSGEARPLATTGIDSGEARPLATTGIDSGEAMPSSGGREALGRRLRQTRGRIPCPKGRRRIRAA